MTQTLPGAATRRGVLAIDEGTTGTRAGVVLDSGAAHEVFYRSIEVSHPDDLSVEQDPMEIWTATLDVARRAVGAARADGIAVTAVALSTQRATAMLWDRVTGRPLLPAVVWQDRRYAAELTAHEAKWDAALLARQGRRSAPAHRSCGPPGRSPRTRRWPPPTATAGCSSVPSTPG